MKTKFIHTTILLLCSSIVLLAQDLKPFKAPVLDPNSNMIHNLMGLKDENGKVVIEPKYIIVRGQFSEGLIKVSGLDKKWGYIDKTGKEVIPLKYDFVIGFKDGLTLVKLDGKSGYIDKNGKEVIPVKYDDVNYFSGGLARIELDGKYGYTDKTGKEVIPLKYDGAGDFSEGLAGVELDGKWWYIDKTGKEVIPPQFLKLIRTG